ncbi:MULTISPECIES: type I secretion system permease/ATPase [unclassified Bradyrhizobium]|uniref:type I secretion system permease/ATPase n=1 Tax=unclassified Bradyrhizobium TaxID=2631580 RepID=UPI00068665AB|nr:MULTISPECIES: ATP-binding cassette domain-containing protein [unclassified Bradyrhizobium]QIG94051.1 ATP-binding cassette domain-containing protein [Bradyrhizobium sp. 6(2017)]
MLMPPIQMPILPQIRTPLHAALWSCAGPLGLVFAYSCSYNLLLFAPSIYLLQIYDRVLSSRSGDTLLLLTLIVAITVVVGGVFDALRRALLARLGAWLDDRLRPCVLSAGLESAFRSDWTQASGTYRDLTVLRQFIESGACPMLFDALWTPLFLLVLFLIHPLLGVVGACCVAFLFAITLVGDLVTEDVLLRSGAALSRSYGRLQAAAGNIHMIRAMGMLDSAARMIHHDAQEARREHDAAIRRGEIVMLVTKPVRALSQVLIMGAAAWLVLDHGKSPAIIFASMLMFSRALAPVESAIAGWKSLATAASACQRLGALLAAFPAAGQRDTEISPRQARSGLVVENVGVRLAGTNHPLLNGVSFTLAPGECLGIVGPSGSGKSLLGQVIAGLSMPTHGRVLLDNTDVSLLREGRNGHHLGYLPQDINLIGDTINDIIARLDDADRRKVAEAAKLAGIHEAIMRLPQGYDTVVHSEKVFSRGYRQRLGLARAFFGSPRLVVLDEPNASLDYGGERMLLDAIQHMKLAGVILVVVTHRMGPLAAADKIAIMEDGAVVAFGDSEEIFERHLSRPQLTSQIAP